MAQDKPNSSGPDLSRGIPFGDLPDQGTLIGHVGDQEVLLVRRVRKSSPSLHIARIITGPSPRAWSSVALSAVRGITPVLTCVRVRLSKLQPSTQLRAGTSSRAMG